MFMITVVILCFLLSASFIHFLFVVISSGGTEHKQVYRKTKTDSRVKREDVTKTTSRPSEDMLKKPEDGVQNMVEDSINCNPVTSSPVFATQYTERGVQRFCRCHWPTLFGQSNPFGDCNVHHACDRGKGILVHKVTGLPLMEATPPIRIHDYQCSACDRCNVPGPDPDTGLPSCVPRPFNDRDSDMCIYDMDHSDSEVYSTGNEDESGTDSGTDLRTTKPMLSLASRFVNTEYISMFTDRVRNTALVPNPCAFDLFTGSLLNGDCELRLTRKSKTAYCAPTKDNIMTAVKEDTYLMNNQNRYPNACFRFTSNEEHVNGYVIEYFLRKREGTEFPSPVVSMRIAKNKVLNSVLDGLGLSEEPDSKMLLFTQPEPPPDVNEFPHPFNQQRMSDFDKELNNWIEELPAKCLYFLGTTPIRYNCSAPVQPLAIPQCSKVGEHDRGPSNTNESPRGNVIGHQRELYAKTTVACKNPIYDARFPLVPNYNIRVGSINADPVSTILFFNKTNNTVYPHWKNVGEKFAGESKIIERYIRERLHSVPNEG